MGCDIHTFIEYSDFVGQDGEPYWQCFGGRINTGRDYTLFGVLAGVRDDSLQLFEPRGLPEGKLSYAVEDYMRIRIVSDDEHEKTGEGVTLATAQSWTTRRYGERIIYDREGKPTWVTNPDLHSHSWLTLDELKQALKHHTLCGREIEVDAEPEDKELLTQTVAVLQNWRTKQYSAEWGAVVAAMEALAQRGCQTALSSVSTTELQTTEGETICRLQLMPWCSTCRSVCGRATGSTRKRRPR